MSLFDDPRFTGVPVYKPRGRLSRLLRRPAKVGMVLPIWMGTAQEAAELLAKTPSGPERTLFKQSVFHLMYGRGSDHLFPVDPEVAKAALEKWDVLKQWSAPPLDSPDRDDGTNYGQRPKE